MFKAANGREQVVAVDIFAYRFSHPRAVPIRECALWHCVGQVKNTITQPVFLGLNARYTPLVLYMFLGCLPMDLTALIGLEG